MELHFHEAERGSNVGAAFQVVVFAAAARFLHPDVEGNALLFWNEEEKGLAEVVALLLIRLRSKGDKAFNPFAEVEHSLCKSVVRSDRRGH